ncbi:Netrin receptor UNC5C, partial [Paramuricea clavata]
IKRAQSQNNNNTDYGRHTSASSSGYAGSGENTSFAFIPTKLRRDLIELLDRNITGRDNWKMLAEHLGYKLQYIQWLDEPRIQSPTERLLMRWEIDVTESPEDALRNLEKILRKIERHDAATKIQVHLNECSIGKETTV